MWSSYSVTDRPPVTGTANGNSSGSVAGRGGGEESGGDHVINGGTDSADPLLGLVALQLTVLVFISALGTFANALVFAVFYRRPSLRTISNRFVLSLIMANLTSAAVSIPGHVYQLLIKPVHQHHQEQQERFQGHRQLDHHHHDQAAAATEEDNGVGGGLSAAADGSSVDGVGGVGGGIGDDVSYLMGRLLLVDDSTSSWFSSWHWHKQGLDGLTVLVSLASVLSILLISLDRYYAVNSPLHYNIIVTRQKSIAMIALVWLVAAILSAPVWAGSVLLQHYAPVMRTTPQVVASSVGNRDGGGGAFVTNESLPTGLLDDELHGNGNVSGRDQQMQQQYLMNLCYSISLILFGFVWPLAALCWLYLRMYEAALKNSARTRRQSLCSNTNNNANAADQGIVGVAAAAAASTVAATASSNAEPSVGSYGATGAAASAGAHPPTLADAITSVTTTASAFASENQASARLLAAATAAASASTPQRLRSNRYWLRLSGMQQQLLTLFWREQGRPLRTTAMVISSFTCCWLPFFVWLLPFQIHPSLTTTTAGTLDRAEATRPATAASAGVFLARLAAFSNVLISPAIYVYRNQVAQREAGRVLLLLFCPLRHQRRQSTRYNSHDIATPLVMGGLGVSGMTSSQLHHPQSGEARLRRNSNAVNSSRRSSSLVTNNSTDSPTRKGSDEPMTVMALAQATVVNWRGRSGSTDCRLLTKNNGTIITAQLASQTGGVAQQQQPQHSVVLPAAVPSPLLGKPRRQQSHNHKPRASIPGACCTYSLDRRPSSSTSSSSHVDLHQIEMRQRSQTISETRLTSTSRLLENPGRLSPSRAVTGADPPLPQRSGEASTYVSSSNIIQIHQPSSSTTTSSSGDRGRSKKRTTSTTAAAAAAAAAAVAAAELKALNHPLAYYPSLDFFDIGLEDYGRRSATSSFSRFIQQQAAPLVTPATPSAPQSTPATTPLIPPTLSHQPSGVNNSGRRRRTCSFSKVMSRSTKQQTATGGTAANSRWPAVFGGKQQQEILGKSSASSMPSVQQIPSLVTAV
ncbi:uncharacterized protein LOC124192730 [Daphnia pulex]|uniref:uncharacterized protein LOC124192730 n=1 Tax=Daphnia pulex TaxID=6669 RepID=UPI001EDE0CF9|nr:uncharacterized protein LOC124192730 [Daphnia pulex]